MVHNFNNILSVLLARVELMLGQVDKGAIDPGQLRKALLSIQKGALDAAELLKRLRDIARFKRTPDILTLVEEEA